MVQLGGPIFNKMLGPFNPFKILNLIDNSVQLYIEELKKKRYSHKHKRDEKFSCRSRT